MILGPSRIIHCPLCHGELRQWEMVSGNTFGGELWSDGYIYAPMMMEPILVTRCAHCKVIFWLEDATESANSPQYTPLICQGDPEPEPPERYDLPMIETLRRDGLEEALRSITEDDPPRKELHLLMKWLHEEDHGLRETSKPLFQHGSPGIEPLEKTIRLERLLQLLGESAPEKLLKVYLLLKLQKPEEADRELDRITDPKYEEIKGKFKMVMAQKLPALFRVW